jgi:hypothetical protein
MIKLRPVRITRGMAGLACCALAALSAAGCSSGPSAQQAKITARQARTAAIAEYWDVYSSILPGIQTIAGDTDDSPDGAFAACSQGNGWVTYGMFTFVFPKDEADTSPPQDGPFLLALEPLLRDHGWGTWQAKSNLAANPGYLGLPGAVSRSKGYVLYLETSQSAGTELYLELAGPCVNVGTAQAGVLTAKGSNGGDEYSGTSTAPPKLIYSPDLPAS